MKAATEAIDDPGTRASALVVFEKGVRALETNEVKQRSIEWLNQSAVPEYIDNLKNKKNAVAEAKLN